MLPSSGRFLLHLRTPQAAKCLVHFGRETAASWRARPLAVRTGSELVSGRSRAHSVVVAQSQRSSSRPRRRQAQDHQSGLVSKNQSRSAPETNPTPPESPPRQSIGPRNWRPAAPNPQTTPRNINPRAHEPTRRNRWPDGAQGLRVISKKRNHPKNDCDLRIHGRKRPAGQRSGSRLLLLRVERRAPPQQAAGRVGEERTCEAARRGSTGWGGCGPWLACLVAGRCAPCHTCGRHQELGLV